MAKKKTARKARAQKQDQNPNAQLANAIASAIVQGLKGMQLNTVSEEREPEKSRLQSQLDKAKPVVDNGFRNIVIFDNKKNEYVHTIRHLPKEMVDQIRRAFYRVLVQKHGFDYAISVEMNGNGTDDDAE